MLIEGAEVPRLGVERRIMAIEPVDTPLRFQVGLVEHPPEGGAAHRSRPGVVAEDRRQVIHAPSGRWAVVVCRRTRRKRQDIDAFRGGKAPWPPWPWRILEACEPLGEIPGAPQAHGMTITAHLGGEPEIGRVVRGRRP